ncbi:hypothetical protein SAMN05421821_10977 [Mucilaginibacter lappiensis]|uniref:Uncharacterized protein n=1 Tax=Mucilaginibacter lappiensis TaxID=354630 RepID=A0ABR6PMT1_9SPHI|nr:hypothetical protein [Mucilaginibacter lappiensis]MBB6110908.1 hypothetical protein [Mucilaginibacter lappiensis]SIR60889.1 hypothetical protein SAMN05421821_10977 [Mucilaginibacter lappiensis]
MIIQKAIVSTDANPFYYDFWPLTATAWSNFKIAPVVAVIGDLNLNYEHGLVIKVPLIDNIPTGFIAQVIRFIIPCLFPEEISVIGDIDMIPLSREYFTNQISQYDDDRIIIFSADAYKDQVRYPMCYIAAKGKFFQQIIGLKDTNWLTIKEFIESLYALGLHWETDELFFAKQLHESPLLKKTIFLTRGGWAPFARKRIDRGKWWYSKLGLFNNKYIDAHSIRPLNPNLSKLKNLINFVEAGSDHKAFFFQSFKNPVKAVYLAIKQLKQLLFDKDLYQVLKTIPAKAVKTKTIAFALYGNEPRYIENIDQTLASYNEWLPDWQCRLYIGSDVSAKTIQLLLDKQCEVIIMKRGGIDARYMNWRFLVIEDKNKDAVIIRDIDSFCTYREKLMIDEWLNSEKKFHIIRDHVNHTGRIMGGIWGIKKGLIDIDIKKETKKLLMTNQYGMDMAFLNKIIYPLVKHDVMVHDSFPRFPDEEPIVIPLDNNAGFIGEINTDIILRDRDRAFLDHFDQRCFSLETIMS